MKLFDLTPGQLRRAAQLKEEMDALERSAGFSSNPSPSQSKSKMSEAARAKIAAAMKASWEKRRKAKK